MRAVLAFAVTAIVCIAAAFWVAHLPGSVSATIAGTTFEAATPVALVLLAALFIALYLVVRVLVGIVRIPRVLRRRRRDSNRRRGDVAVSRALVALAANDTGAARREADRSRRLLGDTPLTLLLAAQAGRQGGREAEAREMFVLLSERTDGRLLGLRGLLRQAITDQDWPAATALAQQAEQTHPGAAWLREERRHMALQTGNWTDALRLTGPATGANAEPGVRAALALAAAEHETDPAAGLKLAKQAWDADPSLPPAALGYSARLRSAGKNRRALEVLRRAWAIQPHPDLVEAYLGTATDKLGRMRAAEELAAANPGDPDTLLMLGRVALEAGLTGEARRYALAAQESGLEARRLWVLLADIAEDEHDHDAAQDALRHIPQAEADPVWRCTHCGTAHGAWHPVCSTCNTPGGIRWTNEVIQVVNPRVAAPAAIEGLG